MCELEYTCKPSYLKMGGGLTLEIQNGSRESIARYLIICLYESRYMRFECQWVMPVDTACK